MITYFHHINEAKRDRKTDRKGSLFHHRWFWETKKNAYSLEVSSGFKCKLELQLGDAGDAQETCLFILGFLFGALYFTFPLPKKCLDQRKCIATWDNNREFWLVQGRRYGFYFHDWAFVWHWHAKADESSSKDPWWMHQYIHIDELFIGERKRVEDELTSAHNVWFRLGSKEFKIDSIKWKRSDWFRTFIPFALYHDRKYYVDIKVDNPPAFSGKGENSWDCGDDAIYGTHRLWEGPVPTWKNRDECTKLAVDVYMKSVLKNIKRYGTASTKNENRIQPGDDFKFIGHKKRTDPQSERVVH